MYAKGHLRPTIGFLSTWSIYEGTTIDDYTHALLQGVIAAARATGLQPADRLWDIAARQSACQPDGLGVPGADMDFIPVGPWNTDGLIIIPDDFSIPNSNTCRIFPVGLPHHPHHRRETRTARRRG